MKGLDKMNTLTTVKDRQLMLLIDEAQFKYNGFRVLNEFYHYKLVVMSEVDHMPDGTTFLRLNNTFFSSSDIDYDLAPNGNCSLGWKSGWWFTDCFDHTVCMTCMALHSSKGIRRFNYASMLIK